MEVLTETVFFFNRDGSLETYVQTRLPVADERELEGRGRAEAVGEVEDVERGAAKPPGQGHGTTDPGIFFKSQIVVELVEVDVVLVLLRI